MNVWGLLEEADISLKAMRVAPASVKDQPPIDIQVYRPLYVAFRSVNWLCKEAAFESIGDTWNVDGSKKAKAKFIWVNPFRLS